MTHGEKWGLPPFEELLKLKGGVPGWSLGQKELGEGRPQPSILAPMTVGDVLESYKLDATPATAFSVGATTLGAGCPRGETGDTGTALPTVSGDPGVGVGTSGCSETTQMRLSATRGLVRLPSGEVVEVAYSRPTTWTGPSIADLLQNSPLI